MRDDFLDDLKKKAEVSRKKSNQLKEIIKNNPPIPMVISNKIELYGLKLSSTELTFKQLEKRFLKILKSEDVKEVMLSKKKSQETKEVNYAG